MLRLFWRLFARRRGHPAAALAEVPIVLLVPTALLWPAMALGCSPSRRSTAGGLAGHALLDREPISPRVLPDAAGAPEAARRRRGPRTPAAL
jgi:hypothetical protein